MAGLLGDIYGGLFGSGGADSNQSAIDSVKNIPLPVLQKINPELYQQVVQLNPTLQQTAQAGPSAMDGIALDPQYRQAQLNALSQLQNISAQGGQDSQFKADAANLQDQVNQNLQGQEGAIQQNMAARGMGGGMSEMVQKQMAAQNASNQQASQGLNLNAQAQQRALQALSQGNSIASQMSSTDFNQQAQQAQAQDAISKFNASNLNASNAANAGYQNNAAQWNAQNAQSNANKNVDLNNNAQQWNTNGMAQQNYNNAMGKATGVASQYDQMANSQNADRNSNAALTGNMISAGATAYAGNKKKED